MRIKYVLLLTAALGICGCGVEVGQQSTAPSTSVGSTGTDHAALDLTKSNFEKQVTQSSQVVLVDCWAPW